MHYFVTSGRRGNKYAKSSIETRSAIMPVIGLFKSIGVRFILCAQILLYLRFC